MNKYLRAVASNYFFLAVNTVFFLVITSVAINVMGEELFGLWSILNAIQLFSGIGVLGMDTVVNKYSSEDGDDAMSLNNIFSAAMLILLPMAGCVVLVILLARNWISGQFGLNPMQQEQFRTALTYTALSVVPQFLGRIPHGYLLSQIKNKQARTVELIVNMFMWTGIVIVAFFTENLTFMAIWVLLVQTAGMITLFSIVSKMISVRLQISFSCIRRMLSFSGYTFLGSLGVALFQQFDRIVVGIVLGPGLAGVYSVGTSVGLRISIITGQATEIMIPYASLKNSLGDTELLFSTFRRISKYISLMIAIVASGLIIWMHEILSIWISAEYASKYSVLFSFLIVAYSFLSLARMGHQTLVGLGQVKFASLVYLIVTIFMLLTLYFLSIYFGFWGAISANMIMIFLLLINVKVYATFSDAKIVKMCIADLKWGLMVPAICFGFMLLDPAVGVKTCVTLVWGIFVISYMCHDNFIKNQIKYFFSHSNQYNDIV